MKAARIVKVKQPLEVQELKLQKPRGSQVVVRQLVFVTATYICGKEDMKATDS